MNEIKLLTKLWNNLSRRRHKQLIFIFLLMILSGILEVISLTSILPFLYAIIEPEKLLSIEFINNLTTRLNINSSRDILLICTLIFSCAIIISASIRLLNLWINSRFIASLGSDLSSKIYESILYKNYNYHINNNSSKLIKNITANVDGTMLAINSVLQLGTAFFITLGIICTLIYINWKVALFTFFIFSIAYLILATLTKGLLKRNGNQLVYLERNSLKSLQEGIGAIREVIINSNQDLHIKLFRNSDQPFKRIRATNEFLSIFPRYSMEALGLLFIASQN